MPSTELKRLMSGADAMFLYFERKEMPLHIGCVAILDGSFDEESEQLLAARLPEIPRYRQRVVFAPFNLTHPSWVDDPDFSIRNHITRTILPPPGNERQLSELSGRLFTKLMDRNRPLWDLTVVNGLEHGRSALILRVHHSLTDGVSGMALTNVMFDTTREPRRVVPQPYHPGPLPDPKQVMVEGLASIWTEGASKILGAEISLLRLVQAFAGDTAGASRHGLGVVMPELLRPTIKLPFNGPCSGVRGYCWTSFPFGEALAIRAALGGTVNDVILTVVAGAVSRYVAAHREPLKGQFVRLLVPVNVRSADEGGFGNQLSLLPLSLPLDIPNPAERMRAVAARSSAMKAARVADMVSLFTTGLGWTPPLMQQSLASLPFLPQPVLMFNMVCTNVPGPMIPLYSNGRQLLTYYPHVPCGSDVGIAVAVSSYNRSLYYGVTYDCQAAPDGELFRDFLVEAYEELREGAGVTSETLVGTPSQERPAKAKAPSPTRGSPEAPPVVSEAEVVEKAPIAAETVHESADPPAKTPTAPALSKTPAAAIPPVERAAPVAPAMPASSPRQHQRPKGSKGRKGKGAKSAANAS